MLSPWSAKWSFTTAIGDEAGGVNLISPEAGASGVSVKPIFQWEAIAGADGYELIVSTDASLANPVVLKVGDYALPTNAWQCNLSLDYDATYYWKVRPVSSSTGGDWGAVSAFTTEEPPDESPERVSPPVEKPPPEEPLSQPPPLAKLASSLPVPDWVKYLIGALLATVVLLSIVILVIVRWSKRL